MKSNRNARQSRGSRAGWTDRQRTVFVAAASAAKLSDAQRYVVMRHCGCPNDSGKNRPSVKHTRNTHAMFEQCMAIFEAQAAMAGGEVRPPREHRSWRDAADAGRTRLLAKARSIVAEAVERMPKSFDAGLEQYICKHTTDTDDGELSPVSPGSFGECDGGQLHRIVEALRAYVGRMFCKAGMTPRTFEIPPSARKRIG